MGKLVPNTTIRFNLSFKIYSSTKGAIFINALLSLSTNAKSI